MFRHALSLIALAAWSRALGAVTTLALSRLVSPETHGAHGVELQLAVGAVLFLSRECFRRAALRVATPGRAGLRRAVAVAWMAPLAGAVLTPVACALFARAAAAASGQRDAPPRYASAVWLMGLSGLLELCSEAPWCAARHLGLEGARLRAEAVAVIVRCASMLAAAALAPAAWALPALAAARCLYAAVLGAGLVWQLRRRGVRPSQLAPTLTLPLADLRIAGHHALYVVERFARLEGERIALWALAVPLRDQGAYATLAGFGALITRGVYQPVEEAIATSLARGGDPNKTLLRAGLLTLSAGGACFVGSLSVRTPSEPSTGMSSYYWGAVLLTGGSCCAEARIATACAPAMLWQYGAVSLACTAAHALLAVLLTTTDGARGLALAGLVGALLRLVARDGAFYARLALGEQPSPPKAPLS